ncbi:hypothetical protein IT570_08545 [Candidatus Sumerlaeota bacterium]|nr:hypothetical protein [Candidatus Sumerlaeota bacterium]
MQEMTFDEELKAAFKTLDEERLVELSRRSPYPLEEMSDAGRVGLAFGLLAAGRPQQGDGVLATVQGDGSAPLADFAFVRAFRYTIDNNHAAAIQAMMHLLDDPRATHGMLMRLRLADSLIKLGHHDQLRMVLAPFMKPPGNEHTLEAALIIVDSMLRNKIRGDAMIEQVALIDVLLERGFRLSKVENVMYYGELLHTSGVEGVVGRLLGSHGEALDQYTPQTPVEIEFLLTAGDKYKVPVAIHAAARGYARHPFRFAKAEPEAAAYIFSAHEAHRAAREVLPAHFSRSAIKKDATLARTMIILNYYAQQWKETLAMIVEHRDALRDPELAREAARMRASCEYHLGRYEECLATVKSLGGDVVGESVEATAAEALAALALANDRQFGAAVTSVVRSQKYDSQKLMQYFSEIIHEVALQEKGLDVLIMFSRAQDKVLANGLLDMLADQAVRFSWLDGMAAIAAAFEEQGERVRSLYFRGLGAIERGERESALSCAKGIMETGEDKLQVGSVLKATALRRFRQYDDALACCAEILSASPENLTALGMSIGILRQMARPDAEVQAAQHKAMEVINNGARSKEDHDFRRTRVGAAAFSDETHVKVDQMRKLKRDDFDSVETLRLARVVSRAFDARADAVGEARTLEAEWLKKNLRAW